MRIARNGADKAKAAWRSKIGAGEVFAYYGPMGLKQSEENWTVAQNLPLRFIKDSLQTCVADGIIKKPLPTLNLTFQDLYEVQTDIGLWILNMGKESRKIERGGGDVEIPAWSIDRL